MARSIRLRRWQRAALDQFANQDKRDFLAVATPGAGKTTFALTAAIQNLNQFPHRRIIVVAPTSHLKVQWAKSAAGLGLHLEPKWSGRDGYFPSDMHGIVVTYQQVASDPKVLRPLADDAFIIFDEIHHAGTDRSWGDSVHTAFELAARRLSISGTPFRSDANPIPFVEYNFDEAAADFTYGYGQALVDGGVVRPVFFPRVGGHMEWAAPDGSLKSASFEDKIDKTSANQRLRTALSLEGQWLPEVLDQAHRRLLDIRQEQPDAGGLIITMDQEHARGVAALLSRRYGVQATIAVSEDADASERIAAFADSMDPWIVAVRMVSEGVDIPRLRVGVFATNTTTELFFRQAVGRLVRWTRGRARQKAFMFIPDDLRLRLFSARIGEERKHNLKRREEIEEEKDLADRTRPDEQMSLFQAISAVAESTSDDVFSDSYPEDLVYDENKAERDEPELMVALAPPPLAGAMAHAGALGPGATSRGEQKRNLRKANADAVTELAQRTGMGHGHINSELNKLSGVTRIADASARDLEARLRQANKWIARI